MARMTWRHLCVLRIMSYGMKVVMKLSSACLVAYSKGGMDGSSATAKQARSCAPGRLEC